jgi:4-amino-4-deoxy-L-arabinose transferase-like glycosyltransferase
LIARARTADTQPPASHLLLYALRGADLHREFVARLPSFIAVELAIIVLYSLVARLWNREIGLTVAALAQTSPYLCFYAAEARNYGLWLLVLTTSLWLATRWYEATLHEGAGRTWGLALLWGITNALGLWIHLFHAFAIIAQLIVLAMMIAARRATLPSLGRCLASAAAAQIVTAALFAPWALFLARALGTGRVGVPWTRAFSLGSILYYVFAAHFGASLGPNLRTLHMIPFADVLWSNRVALTLAGAAIVVTGCTYVSLLRKAASDAERRWELLPLLVWPLASIAGPFAYAAATQFPLHPRHLMLIWPVLPLVLALGLSRYRRLRVPLAGVIALQLVALGNLLFDPYYAKDDERGAVAFAEHQSGAVVYVLGDVAPYYATRGEGRLQTFREFAADTDDVWLIDNRSWEEPSRRNLRTLALRLADLGLVYRGGTTRFRGIVLRHWTAHRPSPANP